ncbi:MAG TPA: response regulator [Caldithrix abyssi]|uniref:Response regulator n=1 Tax=Caldithrix abyssi TaxID=187145 RepID=A0A7V5UEM7_CALAY|nr:response regulator [Caldithrix abyssi]
MKKILVVDDLPDVREILSDFLSMKGFLVSEAENGKAGLEIFEREHPDLAIVDIEMPVMNGLQFTEKVHRQQPDFPIIIITAFIQKYKKADLKKLNIRHVLPKPLDLNKLHEKVQQILG